MKKTYLTLIIIFMLLSLLAACVNDTGIKPDAGLPQQSQPPPSPTILPDTGLPQHSEPAPSPTLQPDTGLPQQSQPAPSPAIWPEEYSAALAEYKIIADYNFHDIYYLWHIMDGPDFEEWLNENIPVLNEAGISWDTMLAGDYDFWKDKDVFGYALKDLNGDGSDELILLLKNYEVLAIYSIADGKIKLVDEYWDKYHCCVIDKSGLLYIFSHYASCADWYYTIERLSDDGSELLPIERYGMESFDYDTDEDYLEPHYYKVTDGKKYEERDIISEAEFDEFYEKYPVFAGWNMTPEIAEIAGITFIPILD